MASQATHITAPFAGQTASSPKDTSLDQTREIHARQLGKKRRKAFRIAKRHSRLVKTLRVLFPICALLAISLYFTTSKFTFEVGDIKGSVEKIEVTADHLKMVNPRLEGHNEKSGSYLVIADYALQETKTPHIILLKTIDGTLTHPQEGIITLKADEGEYDSKQEYLKLIHNIHVRTASGMNVFLKKANISLKDKTINTDQDVYVTSENGTIRANQANMSSADKTLTFIGNVRVHLIKKPKP